MEIKKILKEAGIQIGSGGSAGFVEVCIMHPLDLIKTRLQIQSGRLTGKVSDPNRYTGIFDCIKKMYKYEGITSFWKGIIPPILAETPKRAVKFFTFEQYKKIFLFGSPTPTPLTFSLAGLGAGTTEAILVNPFEVVKVTLQANRATGKELPSTWAVTRAIVKEHGFGSKGLNKGVTATIARNGMFNMVYFGFYHSVKGYLPEYEDPLWEFGRKVAIGFLSGTLGSCANIPFDVAKSRIQGPQPVPGEVKYKSTLGSMATVYREEGLTFPKMIDMYGVLQNYWNKFLVNFLKNINLAFEVIEALYTLPKIYKQKSNIGWMFTFMKSFRALYKGLLPKVLRLGPGGAIMLVVYDYAHNFLTTRFGD